MERLIADVTCDKVQTSIAVSIVSYREGEDDIKKIEQFEFLNIETSKI